MPQSDRPTLPERLISNPHFLLWSNVSSFVGLLLTLILWKVEPTPELVVVRDYLIGCTLFAGSLFLTFFSAYLSFRLKRLRDEREKARSEHLAAFHAIVHRLHDSCWGGEASQGSQIFESPSHFLQQLCTSILTETRNLLITHIEAREMRIGKDVAVTLKLQFSREDAHELIKKASGIELEDDVVSDGTVFSHMRLVTMARDSHTLEVHGEEREVLKKTYSVLSNTAFFRIVRDEEKVYCNNDLAALGDSYTNENARWKDFYNSTIVVPVRYKPNSGTKAVVFGLLCVDSLNKEKLPLYNKEETYEILGHSADLIGIVLFGFAQFKKAVDFSKSGRKSALQQRDEKSSATKDKGSKTQQLKSKAS